MYSAGLLFLRTGWYTWVLTLRRRILSPSHPRIECQLVYVGRAVTVLTKYTNLRFVKYTSNLLSHALGMIYGLRRFTITIIFVANGGYVWFLSITKQVVSCSASLGPFLLFVLLTSP